MSATLTRVFALFLVAIIATPFAILLHYASLCIKPKHHSKRRIASVLAAPYLKDYGYQRVSIIEAIKDISKAEREVVVNLADPYLKGNLIGYNPADRYLEGNFSNIGFRGVILDGH